MKVLFICKTREYADEYGDWGYYYGGSGLYVSAKLVAQMLNSIGIPAKVVRVVDNNDIDREVYKHKPTHVVIEALWVVPEKFPVLKQLHPNVTWIVRIHSEIPFIANEGIAMKWLFGYRDLGFVNIGVNSGRIGSALAGIGINYYLLPNYYPVDMTEAPYKPFGPVLNIACFGAIRPLKNQLMQAIAAIMFADNLDMPIKFHINSNRVEQKGGEVLKNIRALFANIPQHTLVEHRWMSHKRFLHLLKKMDVGMNVSLSETYSIITGDMVTSNLPVVVSPEIKWVSCTSKADPNNINDIVEKLDMCFDEDLVYRNKYLLSLESAIAEREWKRYLGIPI